MSAVRRDPETGRFVAVGGDVDAAYEEFDIQRVTLLTEYNTDMSTGESSIDDYHTVEPLGGLGRRELAELVIAIIDHRVGGTSAGTGGDELEETIEMSLDSTGQLTDVDDLGVTTENVESITGLDRHAVDLESEPDILDVSRITHANPIDDTNGNAAAYTTTRQAFIPYRPWFGQGPVLDRHSDLHWHLFLQRTGADLGNLDSYYDVTLVWDVFDRS